MSCLAKSEKKKERNKDTKNKWTFERGHSCQMNFSVIENFVIYMKNYIVYILFG